MFIHDFFNSLIKGGARFELVLTSDNGNTFVVSGLKTQCAVEVSRIMRGYHLENAKMTITEAYTRRSKHDENGFCTNKLVETSVTATIPCEYMLSVDEFGFTNVRNINN